MIGAPGANYIVQTLKCASTLISLLETEGVEGAVADMQQSQRFSVCPLIGPCLHTIRNQDLMVPFEGFEDGLAGHWKTPNLRGRFIGGWAASFYRGEGPCHSTKKNSSKSRSKNAASLRGRR